MTKKYKIQILITLTAILLSSCGLKELTDYDNIRIKASPEMVMPLAFGHVEMKNVLNLLQDGDSLFGENADNEIIVSYYQSDLFKYAVKDLIEFENNIAVGNFEVDLGTISLDYNFEYTISLGDLLGDLSGDIEELKDYDGQNKSFPAYEYDPTDPLKIDLDEVTDFETVTFSSGTLTVEMKNNLPVFGIYIKAELYDKVSNDVITSLDFGYQPSYPGYELYYTDDWFGGAFGLPGSICTAEQLPEYPAAPGAATESTSISLAGLTLSNQLGVRLAYFKTDGSGGQEPYIDFTQGLDFTMKLSNAAVSNGRFKVPQQSITGDEQKLENIKISDEIDLNKATLNSGSLNLTMTKSIPITGTIELLFPSIKKSDGSELKQTFSMTNASVENFSVNLANTVIDFTENSSNPFNTLYYSYNVEVYESADFVDFTGSTSFTFDIGISDLDIQSADGDFGQMEISLPEDEFALSLDILNSLNGLQFLSPELQLIVHNSLSVPVKLALDLTGYNDKGESAGLNPFPFIVPYPDYPAEIQITDTVVIDKDNSNIIEFLSLPPTEKVTYAGNIKMNPEGPPATNKLNHVDMSGEIGFDLKVEVPVHFSTPGGEGLSITDTLNFDGGLLDFINSGELIIKAENGLPVGVELELAFMDSITDQVQGEKVSTILLEAAQVDETGKVTINTTATHTIALTKENIPDYRLANSLIFVAKIKSPGDGEQPAKLSSTNEIYLNVGLKAAINLNQ